MKNVIATILTLAVLAAAGLYAFNKLTGGNTVTKQEFEEAHKVLNLKIDSLKQLTTGIDYKIDSVRSDIKVITNNIDTLKHGQVVIFETMTENKNKSFWDFIK